MEFNHLHFYVDDVVFWHDWFVDTWGSKSIFLDIAAGYARGLVCLGQVPLLFTAPRRHNNPANDYLQHHPPGIGDLAFRVNDLDETITRVLKAGGTLLQPCQQDDNHHIRWCQIQGWPPLRHTLIQPLKPGIWIPELVDVVGALPDCRDSLIEGIDHAVLNVAKGQLAQATNWYVRHLGFKPRQQFTIDTSYSGLKSQVLAHPDGSAQLPINEPATPNSQVQEFLDWNRGPGIQHVALHSRNIFQTVQSLKTSGIAFLEVPDSYYEALYRQSDYQADVSDWLAISRLKILVDWDPKYPQAQLLQTFTQPLLDIPTLFFELIQRRTVTVDGQCIRAKGFGERNFRALFEAIEREQRKRGSLKLPIPPA